MMEKTGRAYLFVCIAIFSFFAGLAQNSVFNPDKARWKSFSFNFQENFQDSLALWPERVLLQIANKNVNSDDPIFFKAYLSSKNQSSIYGKSGVLNLEILDDDGALLKRQFHKIVDGTVQGQLELPRKIAPGNYSVKAYTRWSQNYGSDFAAREQIQIGDREPEESMLDTASEISITPEGGTLLSNYKNRIIVKVPINRYDKGSILDENEQEVAKVSFYSSGLGAAIFEPITGKKYQLELEDGTLVPITQAAPEGYLLQVNNLDEDNAIIRITASDQAREQEVTLIGESGGVKYFEKELSFRNKNRLDVVLSKLNFPQGTFNLKLEDALGAELAKRPIWIKQKGLQIDISPIDSSEEKNLNSYKIKVTDHNNRPVTSQLALSVNQYGTEAGKHMDSDIIEQNDLFAFSDISEDDKVSAHRKESFLKDMYVLVSNTKSEMPYQDNNLGGSVKFPFQKGLEIIGHAYDLNNNLLSNTRIQLVATSKNDVWVGETETDAQGIIRLEDIQIEGEATLVARTEGDDVTSRLVKIVPINMMEKNKNVLVPYVMKNEAQSNEKQRIVLEPFNANTSEKTIELKEVEVVEKGIEQKKLTPSLYGINVPPNRVNYQDFEKPKNLLQLLADLPGVAVGGPETLNPYLRVIGVKGPILWVVDGFPLSQNQDAVTNNYSTPSSPLLDIMAMVNGQDIERVELLKGAEASIYGSRAAGGVIVIYTRTGNELEYVPRKDSGLVFEGYQPALDFDQYKEELSRRKESRMNLLYWNPNLQTDENGEAIIELTLPKDSSSIKIEASAISVDGKIGASSNVF